MIKIFRKIRQKLLSESEFTRYLMYATGEIILVVIGILIAISINNWNEERKYKSLEIKVLKDLKNDLWANVDNLKNGIEHLKIADRDMSQVLIMYEEKKIYHDSLLPYFSHFLDQWDPDFTYAGFEKLKGLGVNIISNPSLRKNIINLFEVKMDILDNTGNTRLNQLNAIMVMPMIKKYFFRNLNPKKNNFQQLIPSNFNSMMKDQEFYNICSAVAYQQKRTSISFLQFNELVIDLISKIESHLSSLE